MSEQSISLFTVIFELIDTLWNVNRFKAVASLATVSN